ncbi:substrate-binding domain-containing protein [Sorangium sp. So ce1014]|uniref:substrate-binding domain-containing protein n=1 Tax=Sorangium sp. So ce1014 TaxID=3133326 RepID=UPI003F624001
MLSETRGSAEGDKGVAGDKGAAAGEMPAKAGGVKIALLLPESKTARYESKDRPFFEAKVKALCPDCQILASNANQDASQQQAQAEAALTNGASVLVLDAVDSASAAVQVVKEYDTPDWSPDKAQDEMTQALIALNNQVDGVYAANDGTAGGAIAAMMAAGIKPLPPVTGQDTELAAVQRILLGEQYMTVYKAIKPQAEAAAVIAYHLATGKPMPTDITGGTTVNNGKKDVPSVLLVPLAVTKENLKDTVIADAFWTTEQICTAQYAEACKAAGIL